MITIGELFTDSRFPLNWKLVPILLYSPAGVILAVIRVFIAIQVVIAATVLSKLTNIRSVVLRLMFGILGIYVIKENEEVEDDSVKIIVSNHVSVFDHLAIYFLKNSVSVNTKEHPSLLHYALNYKDLGNSHNEDLLVKNVKSLISDNINVDVQPEVGITSGKKGLLRFSSWPCKLSYPIQPVAIKIWRPPLVEISPSVVGSFWTADLFWFLFVPLTVFRIKFIPVVHQRENETPEEMAKRLEKLIADELKIVPTTFTVNDKIEYEKRLAAESNQRNQRPRQFYYDPSTMEMASRVKEILSDVPLSVICKDLVRTRSVDLTVANLLEGSVRYTPERNPVPASQPVVCHTRSSLTGAHASTSCDTSSKIFHKSAKERMMSFQERKLRLIQSARQKYLEKHALNIMNSS